METVGEFVPEPGPGLIAHIAIVVARDDDRVRVKMDEHLAPIEIRAPTADDLAVRVGRYGSQAIRSIGDPGDGNVAQALYSAIRSGLDRSVAVTGAFYDSDAEQTRA